MSIKQFYFFAHRVVCALLFLQALTLHHATAQPIRSTSTTGESRNEANDFPVTFVDVAERAGLSEPTVYGGVERKRFIIETNGCGVAFVDYDKDGWITSCS